MDDEGGDIQIHVAPKKQPVIKPPPLPLPLPISNQTQSSQKPNNENKSRQDNEKNEKFSHSSKNKPQKMKERDSEGNGDNNAQQAKRQKRPVSDKEKGKTKTPRTLPPRDAISLEQMGELYANSANTLSPDNQLKEVSGGGGGGVGGGLARLLSQDSFENLGISQRLVAHLIGEMKLSKPTVIQARTAAFFSQGRDILMKSETGSGKTLAFLIPIVNSLASRQGPDRITRDSGTLGLVLAPTRELALQIYDVLTLLLKPFHWIIAGTLMGGERKKSEKARLRKGVTIVVGCPGRVLDHLQTTKSFSTTSLQYLVLDEADRLLDMGFEKDLNAIVDLLNARTTTKGKTSSNKGGENKNKADAENIDKDKDKDKDKDSKGKVAKRQNILVSATLGREGIDRLTRLTLQDPVTVDGDTRRGSAGGVSGADGNAAAGGADLNAGLPKQYQGLLPPGIVVPQGLVQYYIQVKSHDRLAALCAFLRWKIEDARTRGSHCKVVVFVSTCAAVDLLFSLLSRAPWPPPEEADAESGEEGEEEEGGKQKKGSLKNEKGRTNSNSNNSNKSNKKDAKKQGSKKGKEEEEKEKEKGEENEETPLPPLEDRLIATECWRLHGELEHSVRTTTFRAFSQAESGILFCTDVAARGLDLPQVHWIVQYDPPDLIEDYIHRVGRTSRMGSRGLALLFLSDHETEYLTILRGLQMQVRPVETTSVFRSLLQDRSKENQSSVAVYKNVNSLQNHLQTMVKHDAKLGELAGQGYWSYIRAYGAYPKALKGIFHPKKLHLGHVARSFALPHQPKQVIQTMKNKVTREKKRAANKANDRALQAKQRKSGASRPSAAQTISQEFAAF